MKAQILSFPMVGGKFCGNLRNFKKIAIECVKLCALCSTFSKLLKCGWFFCFKLIFCPDVADVKQKTIHHVKEQLISFHMRYDLLQENFLNHLKLEILSDQSWKKVVIFLFNKKTKSYKTPSNSLNISKYDKNWADTITLYTTSVY